jgi:hypothetical protein
MIILIFQLFYILTSQHEEEKHITSSITRIIELLNKKCTTFIPQFKRINIYLLAHLCTMDNPDMVYAACNLIVSSLLHNNNLSNSELMLKLYQYIKVSMKYAESQTPQAFPIENFEAILLVCLSYWACYYTSIDDKIYASHNKEITTFCYQTIIKMIE